MLTTAVCSSQVAVESRLHGLTSGRVMDTKSVKTVAWAIVEVQYGESIAAARALVAANLSSFANNDTGYFVVGSFVSKRTHRALCLEFALSCRKAASKKYRFRTR